MLSQKNAQIQAEYMTNQRGNQAVVRSQGVGGSREIGNKQIDPVEVRADRGRRGSLDVGALIRAQFSES